MKFEESKRLRSLPPYLFAEIDEVINKKKKQGLDVISLGIGDPDIPTPGSIIDTLYDKAKDPVNHQYPSSYGLRPFREAVADFYYKRFNVTLDPETEVIPLMGSKEGIANIAYTYIDPGDHIMVPDPSYLVYKIGTIFAGGIPHMLPLEEKNNFLIDLDNIDPSIAEKTKILHINYPNNPTSAVCGLDFFKSVADYAHKYNILICHDNAYSDIYWGEDAPGSFLNADGAKDAGIEFNSLSKTFNMTGWRIGYAVGNKEIIKSLGKYKTNVDSGVFNAVQHAAVEALAHYEEHSSYNNKIYKKRRRLVTQTLEDMGIDYFRSDATIYVWAKVPEGHDSGSFARLLLDRADVVITPGNAFGEYGEGYFRISLTISEDRLKEALSRIKNLL